MLMIKSVYINVKGVQTLWMRYKLVSEVCLILPWLILLILLLTTKVITELKRLNFLSLLRMFSFYIRYITAEVKVIVATELVSEVCLILPWLILLILLLTTKVITELKRLNFLFLLRMISFYIRYLTPEVKVIVATDCLPMPRTSVTKHIWHLNITLISR